MQAIQLIAGLGNPGSKYDQTRHNAGFWFLDDLLRRAGCGLRADSKFHGEAGRCTISGRDCRVLKPTTFMNRSGQSVAALAGFFKIPVEAILVVHDDVDLSPGVVKLKKGGGHGGHNGLRDMINVFGSNRFARLRLGVGHPGNRDDVVDYVLGRPSREDRAAIDDAMDAAMDVIEDIVAGNFDKAMQTLHSRGGLED